MNSQKLLRFFRYKVERLLIRGPFYQVFFIACVIGLISLGSGYVLLFIENVPGGLSESSWWAFLRMSDPGYLGDDNGVYKRILSTVLTVLGYVLFMGSFVAIMTQWLYRKMEQLESGLTPITNTGHICVLGYTSRTPIILNEIFSSSGRLKRFLKKHKKSNTSVAILNHTVGHQLSYDISTHLQNSAHFKEIILRTGSAMKVEDLSRINVQYCSRVIIPAVGFGNIGYEKTDINAIKALLSIKHLADERNLPLPVAVVEILDEKKISIAKNSYGPNVQIIAGHQFISRMVAQNTHHPGISHVYDELLSQKFGNEFYLKHCPEVVGAKWRDITTSFERSIPIGIVNASRSEACILNPDKDIEILEEDLVIFISESFEDIRFKMWGDKRTHNSLTSRAPKFRRDKGSRKILILGWSQKVPILINELTSGNSGSMEIDLMTVFSLDERLKMTPYDLQERMKNSVNHIVGDYTVPNSLNDLDLTSYTNILFLASGWLNDNIEADARSIMGYLLVQEYLKDSLSPSVLVELVDPANEDLFTKRPGEIIISPIVISSMLANVALRPELNEVLDKLFYAEGPEMLFVSPEQMHLFGNVSFAQISQACMERDAIAVGVMTNNSLTPVLNPPLNKFFESIENEKIIVIQ